MTDFNENFAAEFESLSKLLHYEHMPCLQPASVSRADASPSGPGAVGPSKVYPGIHVAQPQAVNPNEIWSPDEIVDAVDLDMNDDRIMPEYEFVYKQAVQSTDTYLGIDPMGKDPTSTSCEDLILKVTLPNATSATDVDIELQATWIVIQSGM